MARFKEWDTETIYNYMDIWRDKSLIDGSSILWPTDTIWTLANLNTFKVCFIENLDESSETFENKLKDQLKNQPNAVIQLACELVYLYLLFTSSITSRRKKELIRTIASYGENLIIDDNNMALIALEHGVGGPGIAYNTRRYYEIRYLANITSALLEMSIDDRKEILLSHTLLRNLLDQLKEDSNPLTRHILLHMMYPDYYERMASAGHKQQIVEAFTNMIPADILPDDVDERIWLIREKLSDLIGDPDLDFYRSPIIECWDHTDHEGDILPIQGLQIKKQVVFYGPPGTGKTHEAKDLAERFIRQEALRLWGAGNFFNRQQDILEVVKKRVHRVQFHPGYGYEDFIRGLQLDNGQTVYKKGVLLQVLEQMETVIEDKDLPFVLILDEMNRADLSKVLGECFSLLEDRDNSILLAGQDGAPLPLLLPSNLYIIGTMNLIDQSLEQVDFALRRRFLWFFRGFERSDFMSLVKLKWSNSQIVNGKTRAWSRMEEEFELLADRCVKLNKLISSSETLGPLYEIGHTYFSDVVPFAHRVINTQPSIQQVLWNRRGQARSPVKALWNYSLSPLLEQYLSGVDKYERNTFILQAKQAFLGGEA